MKSKKCNENLVYGIGLHQGMEVIGFLVRKRKRLYLKGMRRDGMYGEYCQDDLMNLRRLKIKETIMPAIQLSDDFDAEELLSEHGEVVQALKNLVASMNTKND